MNKVWIVRIDRFVGLNDFNGSSVFVFSTEEKARGFYRKMCNQYERDMYTEINDPEEIEVDKEI